MSMAFPSPEFIPPGPPCPGSNRPWYLLRRQTLVFLLASIVGAGILQLYSITDMSGSDHFLVNIKMEMGFPLPFLTSWVREGPELDVVALLADALAVGVHIVAFASWVERWLGRPVVRYKLHFRTVFFLLLLILGGVGLEAYPSLHQYSESEIRRNDYFDNLWFHHGCENGLRWSGRGIPFTYHRVDPVQTPETAGYIAMNIAQETRFYSTILIFDFLLVGLAIAEATYWFERRLRGRRILIIGEGEAKVKPIVP
jgi:hypothetical protein